MGCDPDNTEINPSFCFNGVDPLWNWGEARKKTDQKPASPSVSARLQNLLCTFILNGPSGCHPSKKEKSSLVWTNGYCFQTVVSISIGKPVLKLGGLAGSHPESNASGHIRLGPT